MTGAVAEVARGADASRSSPDRVRTTRLRKNASSSRCVFSNASTTELGASVLKCTLFGAIIAIVCCYKGMTATGGAAGVGRAVNEAVVISLLGVFAFNYVFTQTMLATNPELQTIK